ncbi:MAG: TetR/AcrR family transcriptional regulator [Anaeroplasmataceae bacterium]|nr:TetR/AcrR family transcriptional regulator [Anaeroplasmataceae bacterium]MDE6241743.1 TetR/AcrR family transcriptional regulator [Anaeroplasmataceae bacterium]
MKRIEQKEKRRREILNVGLDLFIRKGYAGTRTAEIANIVGISEGLLFHYFETKEKLYLTLIEIAINGKDNIFQSTEESPIGFYERTAKEILDYITKEPFAAKLFVLMNRAQYDEVFSDQIHKYFMRKQDIEYSVNLIKQGQREGSIREGNPIALVTAFFMAIQGIAESIVRNPEMPIPNSEWIVDIIRSK